MKHPLMPTATQDVSLRENLSQTPAARYQRQRHLNPAVLDHDNAVHNRNARARRHVAVARKQDNRARRLDRTGWLEREVAHHLARGRDAGAIAVWCNVPVVRIQGVIARLQGVAA